MSVNVRSLRGPLTELFHSQPVADNQTDALPTWTVNVKDVGPPPRSAAVNAID